MKHKLTIIPGTRIGLFVRLAPVDMADRMQDMKAMARFCAENGLTRLIVDLRQEETVADTMDMYGVGRAAAEKLGGIKIALVCTQSDEDARFAETVAGNRGVTSDVFSSIEDAQKWLEG